MILSYMSRQSALDDAAARELDGSALAALALASLPLLVALGSALVTEEG